MLSVVICIFVLSLCCFASSRINIIVNSFNLADYEPYIAEYRIESPRFKFEKPFGPVDSARDAKQKAEIVWLEIYGEGVKKQRPYNVFFDDENQVWLVNGSLKGGFFDPLGLNMLGGTAHILLQRADGEVLAVWHSR